MSPVAGLGRSLGLVLRPLRWTRLKALKMSTWSCRLPPLSPKLTSFLVMEKSSFLKRGVR